MIHYIEVVVCTEVVKIKIQIHISTNTLSALDNLFFFLVSVSLQIFR